MKTTLITIIIILLGLGLYAVTQAQDLQPTEISAVDISLSFSLADKVAVKRNLGLTVAEGVVLDKVLDSTGVLPNDIQDVVNVFIKMANENQLTQDEFKHIAGIDQKMDIRNSIKFLSRKKVMTK